jgi:hypothetical protein
MRADRARLGTFALFVAGLCAAAPVQSVLAEDTPAPAAENGNPEAAPPEAGLSPQGTGAPAAGNAADDLLMRRERYFYSSFARRDPFASLLSGDFASTSGDDLLDIGEITLVGVMWGTDDKFAIVQDQRKHVHVLRVGDRVVNGKVIEVTRTSMTVQHYFFGESVNVTIQMNQGDGVDETQ